MIQTVNFIFIFLISLSFTKDLPLSYKYELSFGYDDNFMRFSGSELNTNHNSIFIIKMSSLFLQYEDILCNKIKYSEGKIYS